MTDHDTPRRPRLTRPNTDIDTTNQDRPAPAPTDRCRTCLTLPGLTTIAPNMTAPTNRHRTCLTIPELSTSAVPRPAEPVPTTACLTRTCPTIPENSRTSARHRAPSPAITELSQPDLNRPNHDSHNLPVLCEPGPFSPRTPRRPRHTNVDPFTSQLSKPHDRHRPRHRLTRPSRTRRRSPHQASPGRPERFATKCASAQLTPTHRSTTAAPHRTLHATDQTGTCPSQVTRPKRHSHTGPHRTAY